MQTIALSTSLGDWVSLTKPRITFFVLLTTATGLWLMPIDLPTDLIIYALTGTSLMVAAANVLNMYLERDVDALMTRTCLRPLPAKRLEPEAALWFGLLLAAAAAILLLKTNLLTFLLGIVSLILYVLFYTPLKQKTLAALFVGAIPGAMPPLMGWTAATDSLNLPGLVLFAILYLWQIPHFLAISLMHKEEYRQAGIRIMPLQLGDPATRHSIFRYSSGLVALSLYPVLIGMGGTLYLWIATLSGTSLLILGFIGLQKNPPRAWARVFFIATVLYLPLLLCSLWCQKIIQSPFQS